MARKLPLLAGLIPVALSRANSVESFNGHLASVRWLVFLVVLFMPGAGHANPCAASALATEEALHIPSGLLLAIGRIESGRRDDEGRVEPWPWSVNAEGEGHFLASADEAIDLVHSLQARGVSSIDVGCFQVNLLHHPNVFKTLADAFDPAINARAAGNFLSHLYRSYTDWERATASYHSADPSRGLPYLRMVVASWHGGAEMASPPISQVAALVRVFVPQALVTSSHAPVAAVISTQLIAQARGIHLPVVIVP